MKKRARVSLTGLALLALAGGLELLVVDGTLSGRVPLRAVTELCGQLGEKTTPSAASAQQMYIWKDASGVTHISETPPPSRAGKTPAAEEYNFSPEPPAAQPAPVEPLIQQPQPSSQPEMSAAKTNEAIALVQQERQQEIERLQKEREHLERQFVRARNAGDGYAQIRFRTLLERNREALLKLAPQQQ